MSLSVSHSLPLFLLLFLNPLHSYPIHSNTIQTIQNKTIQYKTVHNYSKRYKTVQNNTLQYNTIQYYSCRLFLVLLRRSPPPLLFIVSIIRIIIIRIIIAHILITSRSTDIYVTRYLASTSWYRGISWRRINKNLLYRGTISSYKLVKRSSSSFWSSFYQIYASTWISSIFLSQLSFVLYR